MAQAAFQAGTVQRNLLLMRLYVTKFLVNNDASAYKRVILESEEMIKNGKILKSELNNPTRKKLAQDIETLTKDYLASFHNVNDTINARNKIISETLDTVGPKVANNMEVLKLASKKGTGSTWASGICCNGKFGIRYSIDICHKFGIRNRSSMVYWYKYRAAHQINHHCNEPI